jgi:hypothetical protein
MHPWNLPCPTCGAPVGRPCLNAWGYPVGGYHAARVDRARGPR